MEHGNRRLGLDWVQSDRPKYFEITYRKTDDQVATLCLESMSMKVATKEFTLLGHTGFIHIREITHEAFCAWKIRLLGYSVERP